MKPVWVITAADPFSSARAAEAVRVAAGLQQSGSLTVTLVLAGPAGRCLEPAAAEGIDGNLLVDYLPLLRESGGEIITGPAPALPPGTIVLRF